MSFPEDPNDILVNMYCASTSDTLGAVWRDISSYVLHENEINIDYGRANELQDTPPSQCEFALRDDSGDFTPSNPMGQYFNTLRPSTPVRVGVVTVREDFGTTAVNSWGSATSRQAWSLSGTAADFDKGSGVGTIMVPAAGNDRIAYLPTDSHCDVNLTVTWRMSIAAVTGGEMTPCGLIARGLGLTSFIYAKVSVQTSGAIWIALLEDDDTIISNTVVSGLTYAADTDFSVRFVVAERAIYAKVWATASGEPLNWTVTEYLGDFGFGLAYKYGGWVGLRAKRSAGNTNNNVVVTYKNFKAISDRFAGEVTSLLPTVDTSGNAHTTAVVASGVLRRTQQGDEPVQSPLRRALPGAEGLISYHPMEEGKKATRFAEVNGNAPLTLTAGTGDPGANSDFDASAALMTLNGAQYSAWIPDYDAASTGSFQLRFFASFATSSATNNAVLIRVWSKDGTARMWQIVMKTGGDMALEAYDVGISNIMASGTIDFNMEGVPARYSVELDQNGANVDWRISVFPITASVVTTFTGTLVGRTIGQFDFLDINPVVNAVTPLDNVAFGHLTTQNIINSLGDFGLEQRAYAGEEAWVRWNRLLTENGIVNTRFGNIDSQHDTAAMGIQRQNSLITLLRECVAADMGSMYESRSICFDKGSVPEYRSLIQTINQTAMLTLSVASKQVAPGWSPTTDDQGRRNDVTAQRLDGGFFRVVKATGANSTLPADQGGIGVYDVVYDVNAASDLQLSDIAAWQVALGTADGSRFPQLTINLGNSAVRAAGLANAALDVFIDDLVVITSASGLRVYDDVRQLARGYHEVLSSTRHEITFNATPAQPYLTGVLDAVTQSSPRLVTEGSYLDVDVTSSGTSLKVWNTSDRWITSGVSLPFDLMVNGEKMTVTAISAAAVTVASTGTATHGNNASVTPGLPGTLAVDDWIYLLSAIRNSGIGTPNTPTGYELVVNASNARLFRKKAVAADLLAAPTCSYTGGVANATTSAQMASIRGLSSQIYFTNTGLNGSAQNITYVPPETPHGAPHGVLLFGWKQDDWTSVATVGGTEVGDVSSTTGDDQGLVWDLMSFTGIDQNIVPGSFTVTGGAAAISRYGVVVVRAVQTMTVTRGTNGVTKSHLAGTPVQVFNPFTLAL